MANTYELIVRTVDQSSRALTNVQRGLQRTERQALSLRGALGAVSGALALIGSGNVIRSIVNTTARFEDLRTTLNSVTGSARAGGEAFAFIQNFATRTQFGVEELTNAYIKLASAGIQPTEALLTTFTDTAAVTTDQLGSLEAITDLFSRTVSGGLGLEELNRLADRGVPVFRILEEQLGLTRLEVSEFGKTAEGANQIRQALQQGLNASFGGATAGRLGNLSTAMSNFGIAVTNTAAAIGEELRPALTDVINDTTQLITNNQELAQQFGVGLGEAVRGAAEAVKFLAANFELIRDAALTLIFLRIAASTATLVTRLASAIKNTQDLAGAFGTAGRVIRGLALNNLISKLTGISAVITTISRLSPISRVISVGLTAAIAAMTLFRDTTFQVGETTTTLSEIAQAVFFKIGQLATAASNILGNAWQNSVSAVNRFFSQAFGTDIPGAIQALGAAALDGANYIIGVFVVAYRSIVGIFRNLPSAFVEVFLAIGRTAIDFGSRLVNQFGNVGEALLLAIQAPFSRDVTFQDALEKLTTNAFEGLGASIGENFAPVTEGIRSALESASDALSENYIENALAGLGAVVENTVLEFREFEAATAAAAAAFDPYDDAILRAARGLGTLNTAQSEAAQSVDAITQAFNSLIDDVNQQIAQQQQNEQVIRLVNAAYRDGVINVDQYRLAMQGLGVTIAQTSGQLSGFQTFLNNTIDTARAQVTETGYAIQAQAALDQQLQSGAISTDVYAAATERLNSILGITTETAGGGGGGAAAAIETVNSTYERGIAAIRDYELGARNVAGAMRLLERDFNTGNITLEQFGIAMEGMGANMDDIQDRSIAMGLTITDAFTKAGDSLASGLARGIMRGEGIMKSFKNFMSSILETILTQIIQQAFINPMISSMTAGFSQAFSAFGMGGIGAFGSGGGLLGGLFGGGGGLFGLLGGFLGFAQGGVVPGRPTAGDSVPILATPGEVILNKQQQAQVLEGGGRGEPITVNFNISAIDTQTGTEFILKNKKQITGVIQQAYNQRGRNGPLG